MKNKVKNQKHLSRTRFSMNVLKMTIVSLFMFSGSLAIASNWNLEWKPKYISEWHIGYGSSSKVDNTKTYSGRVMLGTLQGFSLNEYMQTALGVDAQMLTHYYKGEGLRFAGTAFVNLRGLYPITSEFSPFLDLSLGVCFNIRPSGDDTGFYCEVGPGIKYRKCTLSLGLQQVGTGKGCSHFFIKTGFYF